MDDVNNIKNTISNALNYKCCIHTILRQPISFALSFFPEKVDSSGFLFKLML
jgi:translation elongation factor EF-1beta